MLLGFCNIFCVNVWAWQRVTQQTLKAFMNATDVRACGPAEASKERAGEEEGHSLDRGRAQTIPPRPLQVWQGRLAQHISEFCGFQDSHTGQFASGYLSRYNLAQGLQLVSLQPMNVPVIVPCKDSKNSDHNISLIAGKQAGSAIIP